MNTTTTAGSSPESTLSSITAPLVVFPLVTAVLLVAIWGATLNLAESEKQDAKQDAAATTAVLLETYEAQVLRVLREIDQTLKFVKYTYEFRGGRPPLAELKERDLLPPRLLYVVSIADKQGRIIASTHAPRTTNIADHDYFRSQLEDDALSVGLPRKDPDSGEWALQFSRRLNAADGTTFSGVVVVTVDAAHFVSGYEQRNFGDHGMVGILGLDGVFRAWRSGDAVFSGDRVEFASIARDPDEEAEVAVFVNGWDGVRRYTGTRQLYKYPLAVVVGLSESEQLAPVAQRKRTYLWRAASVSALLIAFAAMLGRLRWQLQQSRLRVLEEQMAHTQRVEHLAYHDALTGLPNRSLFSQLMSRSIRHASRYKRQLAVLFLDLDGFKTINDTIGHEAGDQLLKMVGARLSASLRECDTVARLGGDEFVALLPELKEKDHLIQITQRMLTTIEEPFILAGQAFHITTSIGISIYPQDGQDGESLLKNADIAMYHAKQEGKNGFRFYASA